MEKRHVPALRFKGFTDDWEQRKLGEVTAIFHSAVTDYVVILIDILMMVSLLLLEDKVHYVEI